MIELWLAGSIGLLVVALFGSFIYIELNQKNLDPKIIKTANRKIGETEVLDPNLSLIESHKIMVNTLKTDFKNQKMTSAKMLNKVCKKFKDEK